MKSHAALVSSPPPVRPAGQTDRRMSITRFIAWQKHVPSSTAVLVRLVRLLARTDLVARISPSGRRIDH